MYENYCQTQRACFLIAVLQLDIYVKKSPQEIPGGEVVTRAGFYVSPSRLRCSPQVSRPFDAHGRSPENIGQNDCRRYSDCVPEHLPKAPRLLER